VHPVVSERSFKHVLGLRTKSEAIEDSEFNHHYKEMKIPLQQKIAKRRSRGDEWRKIEVDWTGVL
jgi:hypothetical protein